MFTLIVSFIIATGGSGGNGTFAAQHQVVGDQWATKEACQEAARIVASNHREIVSILENPSNRQRHGGAYIRMTCVLNIKK